MESEEPEKIKNDYIQYKEGNCGLILSVPHGGILDVEDIPDRRCQCKNVAQDQADQPHPGCPVILKNDGFTIDLGDEVEKAIRENLDRNPHVIINHLPRSKLDPNRKKSVACQGNPGATKAYDLYHGYIDRAKSCHSRTLLLDLHGQKNVSKVTLLGYLIKKADLNQGSYQMEKTSLAALAKLSDGDLISGSTSLGAFLEQEDITAIPSPTRESPGESVYYSGGYITQIHSDETCDAIQIETPREFRIEGGEVTRAKFGKSLGDAICNFYKHHYC